MVENSLAPISSDVHLVSILSLQIWTEGHNYINIPTVWITFHYEMLHGISSAYIANEISGASKSCKRMMNNISSCNMKEHMPNTIKIAQTQGIHVNTKKQSIKKIKASAFGLKYNLHCTNGDKRGEELYVKRKTLANLRYNEHDI